MCGIGRIRMCDGTQACVAQVSLYTSDLYMYMYVYMYIFMYVHVYIYVYVYKYINIYIQQR